MSTKKIDCHPVGKPLPRIDSIVKVTGKAKYSYDFKLPGMLYGKILRSPLAHASIRNIDFSEAEKLRGVEAIITYKDVPRVIYNLGPHATLEPKDKYILDKKVRHVGDEVAFVAATDKDTAEAALELIDVDYKELPAVFDPIEAMKPDAPRVHGVKNNIFANIVKSWGKLEKGFREADVIFEGKYRTQAVHACPIEPHACLATYDSGNVRIWSALQAPHKYRHKISQILGMPESKVRITTPYIGGAFGNKEDLLIEPAAVLLSMKTHKPVKIELTREEVFFTPKRHSSIVELKTGLKRDGTLTARQVNGILGGGAYASHGVNVGGTFACASVGLVSLYKTPNFRAEVKVVYTNTPPAGGYRGYGNPQGAFALETQLDQIADELGIDPIELRLKNCIREGDIDPATGWRIKSCAIRDCVEKIRENMKWTQKRKTQTQFGTKKRGIGLAFMMHVSGVSPFLDQTCSASIRINSDGSVDVQSAAVDMGQGSNTALVQIASEELSIPIESIRITEEGDTIFPYDRGSYGSGVLYLSGEAVRRAASHAKKKILMEASKHLDVNIARLSLENGIIIIGGKYNKRTSIADVLKNTPGGEIIATEIYRPKNNAPNFGVQCAEVEVDSETGEVNILKIVYAHDIGKAINPNIVEGQLEGGIAQGLGYSLTENIFVDYKTGRIPNLNFTDYKIPHARDYSNIEAIIVESEEKTGPFSGKGCGESCIVPTAPTVANAIFNAIGIKPREIPLNSEVVFKAIEKS